MQMDRITMDPIISTENTTFTTHFRSRPPIGYLPLPSGVVLPSERDPLVGGPEHKKPFYRARPLWLVPLALTASITRGMTLASRVEVFTELSCRQFHDNYNPTSESTAEVRGIYSSLYPQANPGPGFTPLYLLSIPSRAQSLRESTGDGVSEGDGPRVIPSGTCVSDPAVQAGSAKLQTIMTTTIGVLSALTTSWWGYFGERHGRTRVLAMSTLGLFLTDLIFIIVSTPRNLLAAHSHKLLIVAPIIEGLLGGWSSFTGASIAYIADCTSPDSRATIFARFTGVLFVGLALGPIIGAWLIRNPIPFLKVGQDDYQSQGVNSVFWVATCGSFVNLLLVLFVFPEPFPSSRRPINRKGKNRATEDDEIGTNDERNHTWVVFRVIKDFISPLTAFLPTDVLVIRSAGMLSQPHFRKDWSLTFLAISLFVHSLASGLFQLKYLYAEHVYNWSAEQLSHYISFMGAFRAFHLLVFLPFLLIASKPVQAVALSVFSAPPNTNGHKAKSKLTRSHLSSQIPFDLLVIRCSMFVEFCSHALVVLFPLAFNDVTSTWWSQVMFIGATSLTCASAGVMPAAQSLASCTLQGLKMAEKEGIVRLQGGRDRFSVVQDTVSDPGKLLDAFSVIQAVGSTIVGPIIFGVIYSHRVASSPKAIFVAAGTLVMAATVLTMFVRPDDSLSTLKIARKKRKSVAMSRHIAEERRGRSRVSKDLRGGSASAWYGSTRYNTSVSSGKTESRSSGHT